MLSKATRRRQCVRRANALTAGSENVEKRLKNVEETEKGVDGESNSLTSVLDRPVTVTWAGLYWPCCRQPRQLRFRSSRTMLEKEKAKWQMRRRSHDLERQVGRPEANETAAYG
jgi:hypothetical protein